VSEAGRESSASAPEAVLLSSPAAFNPPGVLGSELTLPALLADAKEEVRVQLLDYAPLSYGPKGTRPYYAVIDNAVRAAANRGVKIKLMVSNWNLETPAQASIVPLSSRRLLRRMRSRFSSGDLVRARASKNICE